MISIGLLIKENHSAAGLAAGNSRVGIFNRKSDCWRHIQVTTFGGKGAHFAALPTGAECPRHATATKLGSDLTDSLTKKQSPHINVTTVVVARSACSTQYFLHNKPKRRSNNELLQ